MTEAQNTQRLANEMKVMERLVEELLIAGCSPQAWMTARTSPCPTAPTKLPSSARCARPMRTFCWFSSPSGGKGRIHMVYGNDPWKSSATHSTRLSGILAGFDKFIATFDTL